MFATTTTGKSSKLDEADSTVEMNIFFKVYSSRVLAIGTYANKGKFHTTTLLHSSKM